MQTWNKIKTGEEHLIPCYKLTWYKTGNNYDFFQAVVLVDGAGHY